MSINSSHTSVGKRVVAMVLALFISVLVLTVILSGCTASPTATSTPPVPASAVPVGKADFRVIGFGVNPQEAAPGQEVQVIANVANRGNAAGIYIAELKVDGVTNQTREVSVDPGTVADVTFRISRDAQKTYTINVGEQTMQFIVKALPSGTPVNSSTASTLTSSGTAGTTSQTNPVPQAPPAKRGCCQ